MGQGELSGGAQVARDGIAAHSLGQVSTSLGGLSKLAVRSSRWKLRERENVGGRRRGGRRARGTHARGEGGDVRLRLPCAL